MVACERCGTDSEDRFRFCPACGAPLPQQTAPRQTRKVVTAFFCDVSGSTALGEQLDPEVLRDVMSRYFEEIRVIIERHGGRVEKFIGDAVVAIFGVPQVYEDDALRAVRAAAETRERLPEVAVETGVPLRFRTGVNTGPVLVREGESLVIGDAVNVAARLEQAAEPGEILLGADTLSLVRDAVEVEPLGPLSLKGKSEPVLAFRLVRVDPVAPGFARRLDVPLVGRERELQVLRQAWERTVEEEGCHLFTLLGPAGVGKSRLVTELLSGVGDAATVLPGRCLHYGEGITFWPLVEALMPVGEPAEQVLERLSTGGAATPEELFWDVRRLLESLATEHPVILHIDDLQWAELTLFDLLDHIADLSRGAPILLLCTARPELLEERPGWAGGKLNATTLLLEPLGAAEAETFLNQLGGGLDVASRKRVIAASQGNPLFLEEMVTLARERGMVEVPPTVQALLAARIERLAAEERELLERGAVEGEVFHRLAVRALANERLASEVEVRLASLVRKELIRPHPPQLGGDDAFRFRHLLIRDAAYDGLPKATRAELHERFAVWLEGHAPALLELHEVAGWHLEQAVRYRIELGRALDAMIARRAAEHLFEAGRAAGRRGDTRAARNLLERALALAPDQSPLGATVALELADQLTDAGDLNRLNEVLAIAEGQPATAQLAELTRLEWMFFAETQGGPATLIARLPEVLKQLADVGDERVLCKAHMLAAWVHWVGCRAEPAAEQIRIAVEHARHANDDRLYVRTLNELIGALLVGPQPIESVAEEVEAMEAPGPLFAASVRQATSELARCNSRFEEARAIGQGALDDYRQLGLRGSEAGCLSHLADVELGAGDLSAARNLLLEADEIFERSGNRGLRSTVQARLADVAEMMGDRQAAQASIELSEELGAAEDIINFALIHGVRARLVLSDGDAEAADSWARSALDLAFQTDFPSLRGAAKLNLARILAALGGVKEARAEARDAVEIYARKGDRPGAAAARALIDELDARTRAER